MAQQGPPSGSARDDPQAQGDPWHAFGYLVSGVFLYGAIGWALDRWLGTEFLVVVGILFGTGLGIFLTWSRFNRPAPDETT